MRRTNPERSIEALTWAAVVIWLGFSIIMMRPLSSYIWLIFMGLGIILLTSAIYQRSRGWHTSMLIWVIGLWMAVFSVIEMVDQLIVAVAGGEGLPIDLWMYVGIALISMGIAVALRFFNLPARQRRATEGYVDPAERRLQVPRRVSEDFSSAYIPPSRQGGSQGWTAPGEQASRAAPVQRSRPAREPRVSRTARPAAEQPSDLESRVEDIIRRSRERRDNLPPRY